MILNIQNLAMFAAIILFFIWCVYGLYLLFFKKNLNTLNTVLLTGSLFCSIFLLRFFISYTTDGMIFQAHHIFDSFLQVLRTFTADGEISVYAQLGEISDAVKIAVDEKFAFAYPVLTFLLKVVVIGGDVAAPVMTLTTVISLLSQLFPKVKLALHFLREKFIFSEINEESVVLAESIYEFFCKQQKTKPFLSRLFSQKPMLIVTDAYSDDNSEISTELMDRLKNIGCICIKEDVLTLKIRARKKLVYILSDKNKMKNLSVALQLTKRFNDAKKRTFRRQNFIYVFTDLNEAEELLNTECKKLVPKVNAYNGKNGTDYKSDESNKYFLPHVIPVKEYKNIVYELLDRLPLYTPLIGKKRKELNVTIFGSGLIGTEAFLAVFWCGQMLDIKLNITVVSADATTGFLAKINKINPDIINSTTLDIPYCSIALIDCDLNKVSYDDLFDCNVKDRKDDDYSMKTYGCVCDKLYKTDYYIVSLGADERNVSAAFGIRRAVERAVLGGKREKHSRAVIAASVYDSTVGDAVAYEDENVLIYQMASFRQRYSYENIINTRFHNARKLSDTYDLSVSDSADMNEVVGKNEFSNYDYWAKISRNLHRKYAMFSVGVSDPSQINGFIDKLRDDKICDSLAWLEHRRWNANLWSLGYRYFDAEKRLTLIHQTQPCLVEGSMEPTHKLIFDADGEETDLISINRNAGITLDDLDITSLKYYDFDVKKYDYPQNSGILFNDEQMKRYLAIGEPSVTDYYSSRKNKDQFSYEFYESVIDKNGERLWRIVRFCMNEKNKKAFSDSKNVIEDFSSVYAKYVKKENLYSWETLKAELTNNN